MEPSPPPAPASVVEGPPRLRGRNPAGDGDFWQKLRLRSSPLMRAWDAVFPPDPGWLRLRQSVRATLAGALTMLVVNLLGAERGVSGPTELFGFAMGLFSVASLRDATAAARRRTLLLDPVPATIGTLLAALLRPVPVLGEAGFVAVLAAVVYAAGRGPRWGSLATVGMMAYLLGLIGAVHLIDVPLRALISVLAVAAALFAHSVLLPERPGPVVARIEADMRRRARGILATLEEAVRLGFWQRGARARLRQTIARLDEAVVVAETALAGAVDGRVLGLEALDLALERVAWKIVARLPEAAERPEIADALARLRAGRDPGVATGSRLGAALAALWQALSAPPRMEPPAASSGGAAAPAAPPALRRVAQAALAIGIAVVLGSLVLPGRWYWAAFAAFVVFLGTRSRGESIAKASQFMVGTIAGVVAGTLIATALSGHPYLSLAGIIVSVLLAFQASTAAYGVMMFWITIILGLLFGMLGYFAPDLLLTRLVEAAIGSASGVAVAAVVWVTPTSNVVALAERSYFTTLASVVEAAGRCLASGARDPALLSLSLSLEDRFVNLGSAARPKTLGLLAGAHDRPRRRMWIVTSCHYRVRDLVRLADEAAIAERANAATEAIAAMSARVAARARLLTGEYKGETLPPAPAMEAVEDPRMDAALLLLRRIEALLRRLGPE